MSCHSCTAAGFKQFIFGAIRYSGMAHWHIIRISDSRTWLPNMKRQKKKKKAPARCFADKRLMVTECFYKGCFFDRLPGIMINEAMIASKPQRAQ